MRKYRVIGQEEIDGLAARIASLITKEIGHMGHIIAVPDSQSSPFGFGEGLPKRKRLGRKRLGGKSMADWVYENVAMQEFTTTEAVEAISKLIPEWKTSRPVDSIRIALKNDPARFEKLPNGKYRKK